MHQQTARVGKNNRAEVVNTPLEFRFPPETKDVFIRKLGDDIVLSPPASGLECISGLSRWCKRGLQGWH